MLGSYQNTPHSNLCLTWGLGGFCGFCYAKANQKKSHSVDLGFCYAKANQKDGCAVRDLDCATWASAQVNVGRGDLGGAKVTQCCL